MSSLLDSRDVLAGLKAPASLSTIGRGYDVAAGGARLGGRKGEGVTTETVSTIARMQDKATTKDVKADQWDSVELVEAVIEEAEKARRQRQLEKALRSKARTTLVERERQRNKERADARLANVSSNTANEGVGLGTVLGAKNANTSKGTLDEKSPTNTTGTAEANNTPASGSGGVNRSANSFAQVAQNPIKKLISMHVSPLPLGGIGEDTNVSGSTSFVNASGGGGVPAVERRGATVISSPRQNPMATAKAQSELGASKLDAFLQTTAKTMPMAGLDDLVARNLSVGTSRRLRREAILARQQRRLLRQKHSSSMSGGLVGGESDGAADFSSSEEEAHREHLKENGGVRGIGVRGALNRQRETVFGGILANVSPSILSSTTINTNATAANTTSGSTQSPSASHTQAQASFSPLRSRSPPAINGLKVPDTLRAIAAEATEAQRKANHLQHHRHHNNNNNNNTSNGTNNNITENSPHTQRSASAGPTPIVTGDPANQSINNNISMANTTLSTMTSKGGAKPSSAPPVVLPSNATFLQLATKASVKDAITAAEKEDRRLKTSTMISTSTDKYGNIVKLDGVMLLGEGTTTVTAQSIATAAQMARVGASNKKENVATKGFFGLTASPLQLLAIPDGTPIEPTTTYKPGAALSTLVDNKKKLSRSHFLESRRETSSFNAPPREPLMAPTSAPMHASYQIRYSAVERQPPSSSFTSMEHHKFNVTEKNKEAARAARQRQEEESFALASQQLLERSRSKSPTATTGAEKGGGSSPTAALKNGSKKKGGHNGGIGNISAINASSASAKGGGGARSTSPTDPHNSTFFNLTQAKIDDKEKTMVQEHDAASDSLSYGSSDENYDGLGEGGDERRKRRKQKKRRKNHELIPTGDRPDVREEARYKMMNTTIPDETILAAPVDVRDFRLHEVRDTSSSFKSSERKLQTANLQDVYYYPLPEPGIANYRGGKIVGNAREREWSPYGKPCGAPTTYNLDLIEERQRQEQRERKTPAFGKIVGRDDQKHPFVLASVPSVDTSQLDYKDQRDNVGKRPNVYVSMSKQTSRPPTKLASTIEAPHMNTNSIVSVPKKGFVDISRMTNYETRDQDYFALKRAQDTTTPLFINPDSVLYTHPTFSFNKGSVRFGGAGGSVGMNASRSNATIRNNDSNGLPPRSHSSLAFTGRRGGDDGEAFIEPSTLPRRPKSTEPTDNGYADDSPVRRRVPATAFPLTDRETRPILRVPATGDYKKGVSAQVFPAKDANYDTSAIASVRPHSPSANFAPLVSREQREKSLQQRFASTDAVYDVPRTDKVKLVLPFNKSAGRK